MPLQVEVIGSVSSIDELRLKVNSILKRMQEQVHMLKGAQGDVVFNNDVVVEGGVTAVPVFFSAMQSADVAGTGLYAWDYNLSDEWTTDVAKSTIYIPATGNYLIIASVMAEPTAGAATFQLLVDGDVVVEKEFTSLSGDQIASVLLSARELEISARVSINLAVGTTRLGGLLSQSALMIYKLN